MTDVIRMHATGTPDVLQLERIDVPAPAEGEVRLAQKAAGFNFIDVMFRRGAIPAKLPLIPGFEASGVVEAVGPGVVSLAVGDRVAYAAAGMGAYAGARNVAADRLVPVPAEITHEVAAATLFKGLTAWYLIHRTFKVKRGDIVLVHAAAGGVGLILCSWAKSLGARVFGTVGSAEKVALAEAHGCEEAFVIGTDDVVAGLLAATGGRKADVVYDSVGKDTYELTLNSLARFGMFVAYGAASGAPPATTIDTLNAKGCLYLTRPSVFPHVEARSDLLEGAAAVFAAVQSGAINTQIGDVYALIDAARLHADVEARRTTGSLVLVP